MIIHLLPGDIKHITIPVIKSIVQYSNHEHFFLVTVFEKQNIDIYVNELSGICNGNFRIVTYKKASIGAVFFMWLLGHRGDKLKQESVIFDAIYEFKNETIVTHFYVKPYTVLPFFKRILWVCWGNIPRQKKNNFVTNFVYKRINRIIVLMEPDKIELVKSLKCTENRILVIPYIFNEIEELKSLNNICSSKKHSILKVLIGNNTHSIRYYIQAVELLKQYKSKIEFHAMMSYGSCTEIDRELFLEKALSAFNRDFFPITKFIPQHEYGQWLNKFDIYLSLCPSQTGLGVIYRMLYLGKKVYLVGHNYEWCKCNDFVVYNACDINNWDILVEPLSEAQILKNQSILLQLLNPIILSEKWDKAFN